MVDPVRRQAQRRWRLLLVLALLAGYWLLPISGQVIVLQGDRATALTWPRIHVSPASIEPGRTVIVEVTDVVPWGHVLLTVSGYSAGQERWWQAPGGIWTWQWTVTLTRPMIGPSDRGTVFTFYRDCDMGCIQRGQFALGGRLLEPDLARGPAPAGLPTKLGVVFANPDRDWHGRRGWDVELAYVRLADAQAAPDAHWGADQLAERVHQATTKGLRVLVRVDYDRGQSLPPTGDHLALSEYLRYLQRLARDDRFRGVYGYIIGSGFNALDSNQQAPQQPVSAAWYARLFNGYGEPPLRADNAAQAIKRENPHVRVLVGPVRPWVRDQAGERPFHLAAPWLSYLNSLVAALDDGARAKAAAGIASAASDGFAINAPGRPRAAIDQAGGNGADEPRLSLTAAETGEAQMGFRVYRDQLAVVNAYPGTRGLPLYIVATNTFTPDEGTPPAQNYPKGWLTSALQVIDEEPQVAALCWFIDGPLGDRQWEWFSLSQPSGRLIEAAAEFDALLRADRSE